MLKLKEISVRYTLADYCHRRIPPTHKNTIRVGEYNVSGLVTGESALFSVKANLCILPEPRWHGFLENLV